jgi:hypothetical protein
MIEETIYDTLIADTAVDAIVDGRVYAIVMPENSQSYPCITFQRISGTPDVALSGHTGLDQVRVQIDCWAKTFQAAKDLGVLVRTAFTDIGIVKSDFDYYEADTKLFRVSQDFQFWQS